MSEYCVELCNRFEMGSVNRLGWYHGCNTKKKLQEALQEPDVHMIEADVTLGHLMDDNSAHEQGLWNPFMEDVFTTLKLILLIFILQSFTIFNRTL